MTTHDTTTMAGWVRELRARLGWTQKNLAERVGLQPHTVTLFEMGRRCPSRPVIILMRQSSDLIGMPEPPPCTPTGPARRGDDD